MRHLLLLAFSFGIYLANAQTPSNLNSNNITSNSVTLSWTSNGCTSFEKIRYKESGSSTWIIIGSSSNIISSPYTITGLNPNTSYLANVRCQGAGSWSNQVNFTTSQACNLSTASVITDASCDNSQDGYIDLTVSGGTAPYTYLWSNGWTTEDLVAVLPGTYSVEITDDLGCLHNDTMTIGFVGNKSITQAVTEFVDTSISNYPGVVTGYHKWAYDTLTIVNTGCDVNIRPEFIVAHENSAIQQGDFVLKWWNPVFSLWANIPYNINSNGEAYGFWNTSSSDSTGINLTQASTQQMIIRVKFVSPANYGNYSAIWETFEVDNLGNKIQSLTNPDSVSLSLVNCGNFSIDSTQASNVTCSGGNDGSASVISIINGSGNYSYSWSNGQNTNLITNLSPGSYTVTVTDNNWSCIDSTTIVIDSAIIFSANLIGEHITCVGLNNGTLNAIASGGSGNYSYHWTPSLGNSPSHNNLSSGSYNVAIVDATCGTSIIDSFTIINPDSLTQTLFWQNNESCDSLICTGNITVSLFGGTQPYTFSWSNGDSVASNSNLCAGSYTITATDANSCASYSQTITINDTNTSSTNINISGINISCNGLSNGSADATVSSSGAGGSGSTLTYCTSAPMFTDYSNIELIRLIGDGDSIVNNTSGICDSYDDFTNYSTTITPGQTYSIDINLGSCNAQGFAFTDGAKIFIDWNIDGDFDDPSEEVAIIPISQSPSTHTVSFTVPNLGISGTTTMRVISQYNSDTFGPCEVGGGPSFAQPWYGSTEDYAINIANTVTLTYLWSTGDTTSSINNLSAGTYFCTVTDDGGCSDTDSIIISEPDLISSLENITNVSCNGGNDGSVSLTLSGGTGTLSVDWFGVNPNALSAGNYPYTVTDSNGCIYNGSIAITEPSSISVSSTTTQVSCNGGNDGSVTINIFGGTTDYTLNGFGQTLTLLGGLSNYTIPTGLPAGSYPYQITDINNCALNDTIVIIEPDSINVIATLSDVSCNGLSDGSVLLSITGGTAPYSENWLGSNPINLNAGYHQFIITDANSCSFSDSILITQPDLLSSTVLTNNVLCNGDSSGSASLTIVGGTAPYSENWYNANPNALVAGVYNYMITDNNGCLDSGSVLISEPDTLSSQANVTDLSSCLIPNGSIDLTVSGGVFPYSYFWNSGDTTANISGLSAGNYFVSIIDSNGCLLNDTLHVSQPSNNLNLSLIASDYNGYNVSCYGSNTGSIGIISSGGTGVISYLWSTGDTTNSLNTLFSGSYIVTITDSVGCSLTDSIFMTQPQQISSVFTTSDVLCYGDSTGSATVIFNGGVTDYWLGWQNLTIPLLNGGNVFVTPVGVPAGTYPYSATDANGCVYFDTIVINQPDSIYTSLILSSYNGYNISCNGLNDASVDIEINGGTTPFQIYFNSTVAVIDSMIYIDSLNSGTYTDSIIDNNGCIFTEQITLVEPQIITMNLIVNNQSCAFSCDGEIISQVNGGVAPYLYYLDTLSFSDTINGLCLGMYDINVIDNNGCEISDSSYIDQPSAIVINLDSIFNVSIYAGGDGSIYTSASGGNGNLSYSWIGPNNFTASTSSINNLISGLYILEVSDSLACNLIDSFQLDQPPSLTSNLDSISHLYCYNLCTGSIAITPDGGDSAYTFLWQGPNGYTSTNEDIDSLCAGIYTLYLSDSTNTLSFTYQVDEPSQISTFTSADTADCYGGNSLATIYMFGGIYPYSIQWDNGATTNSTILSPGLHYVSVTDANGCVVNDSVSIIQPDSITISSSIVNVSCNGMQDGSVSISVLNGGLGPYQYSIDNGITYQNSNTFYNLGPGQYSFIVTDLNNCSNDITITILQPEELNVNVTAIDATCYSNCDGSATVAVFGGTPPYAENWNGYNSNALCAGFYNVIITDSNGCIKTASVTINEPNPVIVNVYQNGNSLVADPGFFTYQWIDAQGNPISGATNQQYTPQIQGEYSVIVIDSNGCEGLSPSIFFVTSVVNNEGKNYINIYPNPTSSIININSSVIFNDMRIVNSQGNVVYIHENLTDNDFVKIDLSHLPKGLYFIYIQTNNKLLYQKVILQ